MICSAYLSAGDHLRHHILDDLINLARKPDESPQRAASCVCHQEACSDLKPTIQQSKRCISQNSKTNTQATSLSSENSIIVSCCFACAAIQNTSKQCGLKQSSFQNGKSSELAVAYNDSTPTEKSSLEDSINSPGCSACVEVQDVTNSQLSELEDTLHILVSDLIKEKSENHVLKRNFLVAKKVLRNEFGQISSEHVENLMVKNGEDCWKGQQEIIWGLKRKVRDLCTAIERLEIERDEQYRKRSQMQSRRSASSRSIPDKGNESWYLELEREEIFRNEERYKKKITTSRDSVKYALERLTKRNEELINEIYVLREKLSLGRPVPFVVLAVDYLRQVENKIKRCLEEKAEERRNLYILQEQICHNCKAVLNLKAKLDTERKNAKGKEATLMSLKKTTVSFCMLSWELQEVKYKQSFITKRLGEMLKDYGKIVARGENIFTAIIADGTILLRKLNLIQEQNTTNTDDGKRQRTMKTIAEEKNTKPAVHFNKMTMVRNVNICKIKLAKYQEQFKHFESQNHAKVKEFQDKTCRTTDDLSIALRNRDILLKLETDINVLKNRKKKISKVASQLPKRKLVKKKNSCPQLTEILEAGRMHFNILKLESKFLRTLIKRIFASRGDDQELLDSFFKRNKDVLLKSSYTKYFSVKK